MAHICLDRSQAEHGDLPAVCAHCGAPAVVFKPTRLAWYPRWLWLVPVLGGPFGLLTFVLRRRARVALPLCARHEHARYRRGLFLALLFLLVSPFLLLGFALGVESPPGFLRPLQDWRVLVWATAGLLFFFVAALAFLLRWLSVRATAITATNLALTNVAEEFANAARSDVPVLKAADRLDVLEVVEDRRARRGEAAWVEPVGKRRRFGRRAYLWGLLSGAFVVLACGGCPTGLLWWQPWKLLSSPPIVLSNPRTEQELGLLLTYCVDYRFTRGKPEPAERYLWVFENADGSRTEYPIPWGELHQRGTLRQRAGFTRFPMFGAKGKVPPDETPVRMYVERDTSVPGKAPQRERVSNVVALP